MKYTKYPTSNTNASSTNHKTIAFPPSLKQFQLSEKNKREDEQEFHYRLKFTPMPTKSNLDFTPLLFNTPETNKEKKRK